MRSLLLGADNVINKCLRRGAAVPIYLPAPSLPRHSSGTAQLINTGF